MRTWVKELIAVALALLAVLAAKGLSTKEVIGTLAVLLAFCHVQVATRLDESAEQKEGARHSSEASQGVRCRVWLERYLLAKEMLWLVYFVLLGAYSALVGVAVFLLYPFWRRLRKRKSMARSNSAITTALLATAILLTGCSTTFETDRDRVFIFGFGVTFAVVSNKTTKVEGETKGHAEAEGDGEGAR